MTTFLLLISLVLNGIAIFSIIILYTRQNRLQEVEKAQEKILKDMEEIFSGYLFEMKEENETFLRRFQQVNSQSAAADGQIQKSGFNQVANEAVKIDWTEKAGNAFKKQAAKAYNSITAGGRESSSSLHLYDMETAASGKTILQTEETERGAGGFPEMTHEEIYRELFVNQIVQMKMQGLSLDEIAKKLNKGTTEIELLLKFG